MLIGVDASRAAIKKRTGVENYSYFVLRHLMTLNARHHYRLYLQQDPPTGLFDPRVDIRVIPLQRLWTHLGLSFEMLLRPPDVLFVPAHVLPVLHPSRSVVTVHDLGYLYYPELHTPEQRRYLKWSTRWSADHARHLIAVSHATKKDLVRFYGADPRRITVVHHGVTKPPARDLGLFEQLRRRFNLPERYVIAIGTLQPRKNYVRLMQAFERLDFHDSRLALVIVGKWGWEADTIKAYAQRSGAILTGHLPDHEKFELLSGAAMFAMPSLYEGFGMSILEAQAAGVPVITSNSSACPEVAGEGALLVNPRDVPKIAHAMQTVLDDKILRMELIDRGYQNARRFSWEECALNTLRVLEIAGRS